MWYGIAMDNEPRPSHEHSVDLLRETRAKQLGKHVRQLEDHLHSRWFDDRKTNKLLKKVRNDIGAAAIDKKSSLLAVGYTYDASGYIDPTPIVIDSSEAHFKGVSIHSVDDEDRVLCDYEVYDARDDVTMWPYSVPPSAILRTEIDMSQRHQAFDYIANSRTFAANMVQSTDFFHLNPEQQHMLLRKKVAEEMIADFGAEYDEETPVRIGCRRYYQLAYGDTRPLAWGDRLHKHGILDGTIIHAVYLESLDDRPLHIGSREDFTYGQGLPCLVLTNDEQETISFIPAADITTFSSPNDVHE
jgi:hypothetical protein